SSSADRGNSATLTLGSIPSSSSFVHLWLGGSKGYSGSARRVTPVPVAAAEAPDVTPITLVGNLSLAPRNLVRRGVPPTALSHTRSSTAGAPAPAMDDWSLASRSWEADAVGRSSPGAGSCSSDAVDT
ncbi:hypothetical protein THAOC_02511, partial [Thalassiosira oceanica]